LEPKEAGNLLPAPLIVKWFYPRFDKGVRILHRFAMELYVLRHAIASSAAEAGVYQDAERPLSDEGRDKMKRIAAAIVKVGVEVDLVLSSPYLRARDTAILAHDAMPKETCLEFTNALASGQDGKHILMELKERFRKAKRIMVVGHEPDLSQLIGRVTSLGRLRLEMKKAGLAKIDITELSPELKGTLEWLIPPKVLLSVEK
jgi:phosphohistidine phosphatase